MPSSNDTNIGFLRKYHEKLQQINLVEFNQELTITPQIINMTSCIDFVLNEIQIVFSEIVDELVASKYDLLEKEQQILQRKTSRPNTSMFRDQQKLTETENILKEKEAKLTQKENDLRVLEINLRNQQKVIEDKIKNFEIEQANKSIIKILTVSPPPLTPKANSPPKTKNPPISLTQTNSFTLSTNFHNIPTAQPIDSNSIDLAQLKEAYENLDKRYQKDTRRYQKQIE